LAWCKARNKGWSTQLLVRFGLLNQAGIELLWDTESHKLLGTMQNKWIHLSSCRWFGGMIPTRSVLLVVCRWELQLIWLGFLETKMVYLENGTYDDTEVLYLHVKYERRLGFALDAPLLKRRIQKKGG
jgi:hypothetical protein